MIRAIRTTYAGVEYRSRVEATWAVFFDLMGIAHQYEIEGFAVGAGGYLPDFWLPGLPAFVEVNGQEPTQEERAKCEALAIGTGCDVLIAVGKPEDRFGLLWFDASGQREGRYVFAQDRIAPCGLWLVAEDDGQWIGPNASNPYQVPRGPMFSGALERAYDIARSLKFDRHALPRRFEPLAHDTERLTA